MAYLGCRD